MNLMIFLGEFLIFFPGHDWMWDMLWNVVQSVGQVVPCIVCKFIRRHREELGSFSGVMAVTCSCDTTSLIPLGVLITGCNDSFKKPWSPQREWGCLAGGAHSDITFLTSICSLICFSVSIVSLHFNRRSFFNITFIFFSFRGDVYRDSPGDGDATRLSS